MRAKRASFSEDEKCAYSASLIEKLLPFCLAAKPNIIHTFIPFNNEPDLMPLLDEFLARNITLIAPKTLKEGQLEHLQYIGRNSLEKGLYHTLYPNTNKAYTGEYTLILVPGLAFDKFGKRLGYGGGYYDRFLEQHPEAIKIGIVYPFQFIERVPVEEHDQAVDYIFNGELIPAENFNLY